MSQPDPYRVLGIDPSATPDEIRAAFRRAVRRTHPDTSAVSGGDAAVRDVVAAYRLLAGDLDQGGFPPPVSPRTSPLVGCESCHGRGVVVAAGECPACRGAGGITSLDVDRASVARCGQCAGVGRVERLQSCARCGGLGRVPAGGGE